MSNTRRARWTTSEVTAANAVDELEAALLEETADAARVVITAHMADVLTGHGHDPDLVAGAARELLGLDDDYWLEMARLLDA